METNYCPLCGYAHDGLDDLCDDCKRKIDLTVSHIIRARDNYQEHLVWEEAKGDPMMLSLLNEGLKARAWNEG
jgi:hypothetical protein